MDQFPDQALRKVRENSRNSLRVSGISWGWQQKPTTRFGIGTSNGISMRVPFFKSSSMKSRMTQPIPRPIRENSMRSYISVVSRI